MRREIRVGDMVRVLRRRPDRSVGNDFSEVGEVVARDLATELFQVKLGDKFRWMPAEQLSVIV